MNIRIESNLHVWGICKMKIIKFIKKFALAVGLMTMSLSAVDYSVNVAYAEVIEQTVDATGEYRLGDNDTRAQAKDLALTDAKRIAAEKVLVYVKSNTVVENFEAIKDRIETYTQAKMQILSQQYSFIGEEGTLCQANIVANVKIDIDEIREQYRIEEQRKRDEQQRVEEEQRRKEEEQRRQEEQRRRAESNQNDDILKSIISVIIGSIRG